MAQTQRLIAEKPTGEAFFNNYASSPMRNFSNADVMGGGIKRGRD